MQVIQPMPKFTVPLRKIGRVALSLILALAISVFAVPFFVWMKFLLGGLLGLGGVLLGVILSVFLWFGLFAYLAFQLYRHLPRVGIAST
jgi:hypothetical protein